VVIAICIVVEQHINGIAAKAGQALLRTRKIRDLRGSLVDRFRKYCSDVIDVELEFSSSDWTFISGLYLLRNCLVHTAGQMDSLQIQQFVATEEIINCEGHVLLYQKDVLRVLERSRSLVEKMYASLLKKFPTDRVQSERL
jgi:hypothetical protein